MIDIDDKLRDDITLKNVFKLMTRVKKNNDKFSEQFFLEENCLLNKFVEKLNPFFTDEKQDNVCGGLPTKVSTLLKYQFLNDSEA